VYFRAGYTPDDYPSSKEWEARLLIERSMAVKCPSISYHLVGTKKIQQKLAEHGVLERYLSDTKMVERLRNCFMGLYSLTNGEMGVEEIVKKACDNPNDYVLKPQREGGGNLITKEELKKSLENFSPFQRSGYILMDRIRPPEVPSFLVRENKIIETTAVSELGIYSSFICNGNEIVINKYAGYLLRTKVASMEDGGVAAGIAVLDSVYLID